MRSINKWYYCGAVLYHVAAYPMIYTHFLNPYDKSGAGSGAIGLAQYRIKVYTNGAHK